MAPIRPQRRKARARVARSKSQLGKYAPPSPTENITTEDPTIPTTDMQEEAGDDDFGFGIGLKLNKKDKRIVKHNTLLNRVREGGIEKSAGKKRRRPAKKLVADITNLGDALPDVDDDSDGSWEGIDDNENQAVAQMSGVRKKKRSRAANGVVGTGKMEMKSLKHKPGAMKRKTAMEERERERFGRNLAGLMAGNARSEGGDGGGGAGDRWKALRGFIEGTLEKDRAFGGS